MSALTLPESLTHSNVSAAMANLCAAVSSTHSPVVISASGLNRFDSSALACLLELRRQAQRQGKLLSIQNLPRRFLDLAQLYGVAEILGLSPRFSGT